MTRSLPAGRGTAAALPCALAALVLAAFLPALSNGFVYDDVQYLAANERIAAGLTPGNVRWAFTTTHASNWHPLTWISYLLDVELFGAGPRGHHLVNLLLHAANAVLLFLILRRATGAPWRSLFAAALFAVHPLRVESAAWAAERKDVLSLFFGLLALAAYLPGAAGRSGRPHHDLALPCFALSLLAKPTLVTFPALLLTLDSWPCGRFGTADRPARLGLLAEKLPYVALSIASAAATYLAQGRALVGLEHIPLPDRAANALLAAGSYLRHSAWPAGLAAFYPRAESIPHVHLIGAAGALIAVSGVAIRLRGRHPALLAGWLWFLIALAPTIGFIQAGSQSSADRYTYVPAIGLTVAAVWLAAGLTERSRTATTLATCAGAIAVLILASIANRQTRTWKDDETLFRHAAAVTEGNYLAHHNLAIALLRRGAADEAVLHLGEALRLRPRFTRSRLVLAGEMARRGRFEEAGRRYREVLEQEPGNAGARAGLALALRGLEERGVPDPSPAYRPPNPR